MKLAVPVTPELLDDLALFVAGPEPIEGGVWLDLSTGEVVVLTTDLDDIPEDEDEDGLVDAEDVAAARRLRAEPERFAPVPAHGTQGRLGRFLQTVEDPALRDLLSDAARGGPGGYTRVQDVLHRRGKIQLWHAFTQEANRELVRAWLVGDGLVDDEDPGEDEG